MKKKAKSKHTPNHQLSAAQKARRTRERNRISEVQRAFSTEKPEVTETVKRYQDDLVKADNRIGRLRLKFRALITAIRVYSLHIEHIDENTQSFWDWKAVQKVLENINEDPAMNDIFRDNEVEDA